MLYFVISLLLLTTFFLVIVLPVFLQATEKLNFNKPKQISQIKKISQAKQNRLKEIEQDFEQGKINSKEYQKLIIAINKEFV